MRWRIVALILGMAAALLWGGRQLSAAAGPEGGILGVVRQVASSALLAIETAATATPPPRPAIRALANADPGPGSIIVSIGPIVSGLAGFSSQPLKAAHTFPSGIQPVVELRDGQGNLQTGDSSTVVTIGIKAGTGTPGATLTCTGGLTRTVSAGGAFFSGCKIDLKGNGYVLEASAEGVGSAASLPFSVVWAGDANSDCQVDILDFSVLVASFGKQFGDAAFDSGADLNGDNLVDIVDFSVLVTLFGTRCPSLAVSPATGPDGPAVTVTGGAYVGNREVAFTLDGAGLASTPFPVIASSSGGFTASFALPAGTGAGPHVLKASQFSGRVVAAAVFTVP